MPTDASSTTPDPVDNILDSILDVGGFDPDRTDPLGGEDRRVLERYLGRLYSLKKPSPEILAIVINWVGEYAITLGMSLSEDAKDLLAQLA